MKRDLKRCLKKKTVPGVLWINITPLFCVYKAPLAPLIVNGIIPHTYRPPFIHNTVELGALLAQAPS